VGVAWLIGAVIVAIAVWHAWLALRNAYERWPDRKLGTALVAATFAALLVTFLARSPVLWGTPLVLNDIGAVLLAAFATIWVAGPMISIGLSALRRLPRGPAVGFEHGTRAVTNVVLGLGVGVVLGVLALPFYGEAYRVPAVAADTGMLGGLLMSVGQALVNEVLLRLFVVTALALVLLRWYNVPSRAAALLAIAVSAVVQVALYVPAVVAVGFPNALMGVAYVLAAAFVPAIALGTLYWVRGFSTALLADATAIAAVLLLAA
jgi:hypothetical protein